MPHNNNRSNNSRSMGCETTDAFLSHLPVLRRFLTRFVRRKHDIDDIAQEAWLRASQAEQRDAIHSPRAFLFRVARNIALNELTRKSRRMTDYIEDSATGDVIEETAGPDERAAQQERLALVSEAVAALPEQCRRVFMLRKVYGYSQKEIAAELGIAISTVEKHIVSGQVKCIRYVEDRERMNQAEPGARSVEERSVSGR